MFLHDYRRHERGLADALNYDLLFTDDVMQLKDGSLLAALAYAGPDLDSATANEQAALARQVNSALATFGDGYMIHADLMRRPTYTYPAQGHFPDPTTRLIDDERRRQYEQHGAHYESLYTIALTYRPLPETLHRLTTLLVDDPAAASDATDALVTSFRKQVNDLHDAFAARFTTERLRGTTLLTYLHTCLSGNSHPVQVPPVACYLDALLAEPFIPGFRPQVGELHVRCLSITGFPMTSAPAILRYLDDLPLAYRWSNRFLFLDPFTAQKKITPYRRTWANARHNVLSHLRMSLNLGQPTYTNQDAEQMAQDANAALAEASAGLVRFGYYTSVLLIFHEDVHTVETLARDIRAAFRNHGFPARIETLNAVEAYLGSLPGHGYPNVRRPLIHTLNLAHLLPLHSVWPGLAWNPCPYYPPQSPALLHAATSGSTPFRFNFHVSDVGHVLVVGPVGSGKSTFIAFCIAQFFRYRGAQVFCFDKDNSAELLTRACGGEHYNLLESDELALCPLHSVKDSWEQGWASEWLEITLGLQGVHVSPEQRREMHRALERLGASASRTMTEFCNTIQDKAIREALTYYTLGHPMGRLLDAVHDGVGSARLQTFELSHLLNAGEKAAVPTLLYLFHRIEQRLDGRPSLIVIDEGWMVTLNSAFGEKVEEWLRTLRKKNTAVVFVTQSLADFAMLHKRELVLESCPTKIFLANPEASSPTIRGLYEAAGLNPRQIELIANAVPKRHYYYTSPLGNRMFDLDLGDIALSFVGINPREATQQMQELATEHGAAWPAAWLARRGLTTAAATWRQYRQEGTA